MEHMNLVCVPVQWQQELRSGPMHTLPRGQNDAVFTVSLDFRLPSASRMVTGPAHAFLNLTRQLTVPVAGAASTWFVSQPPRG